MVSVEYHLGNLWRNGVGGGRYHVFKIGKHNFWLNYKRCREKLSKIILKEKIGMKLHTFVLI